MKKIKLMIVSALAAVALGFGFGLYPVLTSAEEAENSVETSEIISSEEVVEETESVENSGNLEGEEDKVLTYDDILAVMGGIAEKEGFKDERDKTLYYLKTAASAKKVDAMILFTAITLAFFVIYAGVKFVRFKLDTTKKDIKAICGTLDVAKETTGAQTTAINGLIDEVEKLYNDLKTNTKKEEELAMGMEKYVAALRCLIRGTKIDPNLKDEAFRALNEADEHFTAAKK